MTIQSPGVKFKAALFFLLLISNYACSRQEDQSSSPLELENQISEILENDRLSNIAKNDSLQRLIKPIEQDSVRNSMLFKISYHFYEENDSLLFRDWHNKSKQLSLKLKDTSRIAESYWDLGSFLLKREVLDSAYFNYNIAYNLYLQNSQPEYAGRMLTNMAIIEKNIYDLTGSEITSTKALQLLNNSKILLSHYINYNNLGIVYNELKEFHRALEHHEKALFLIEQLGEDHDNLKPTSLNNIGVVYQNMDEHKKAIDVFDEAMKNKSLLKKEPRLYAMLIDNRAYSHLRSGDTIGVHRQMKRALSIRESIEHKAGVVINKIHLSELFKLQGDTLRSLTFLKESYDLAKETGIQRDVLRTLKELSALDEGNSGGYLKEYISRNEELQAEERTVRNKFTKIKFETDFVAAENQKLYEQRNLLIGLSVGFLLLGLSGFVIKTQRGRNRALLSKQVQQEANEKIYQLLLEQQKSKEEGRQKERGRLSKELHDGILAKLFGLRLSLSSLNGGKDDTSIEQREGYLEDLKSLEIEIRQLSHEFNSQLFTSTSNFVSILEDVLQKNLEITYGLTVDEEIDWENLSGNIKLHLLRILQEAVKNIIQHAQATDVKVNIELQQKDLVVVIVDDGVGMKEREKNGGIGLKNIQSRAREMGGSLSIDSTKNSGTKLEVRVPISETNEQKN